MTTVSKRQQCWPGNRLDGFGASTRRLAFAASFVSRQDGLQQYFILLYIMADLKYIPILSPDSVDFHARSKKTYTWLHALRALGWGQLQPTGHYRLSRLFRTLRGGVWIRHLASDLTEAACLWTFLSMIGLSVTIFNSRHNGPTRTSELMQLKLCTPPSAGPGVCSCLLQSAAG